MGQSLAESWGFDFFLRRDDPLRCLTRADKVWLDEQLVKAGLPARWVLGLPPREPDLIRG